MHLCGPFPRSPLGSHALGNRLLELFGITSSVLGKAWLGGGFRHGVGKERDGGRKAGEKSQQEPGVRSPRGDKGGGNEGRRIQEIL